MHANRFFFALLLCISGCSEAQESNSSSVSEWAIKDGFPASAEPDGVAPPQSISDFARCAAKVEEACGSDPTTRACDEAIDDVGSLLGHPRNVEEENESTKMLDLFRTYASKRNERAIAWYVNCLKNHTLTPFNPAGDWQSIAQSFAKSGSKEAANIIANEKYYASVASKQSRPWYQWLLAVVRKD